MGLIVAKGSCGKEGSICFPEHIGGLLSNFCRGCPLNVYETVLDSEDVWN